METVKKELSELELLREQLKDKEKAYSDLQAMFDAAVKEIEALTLAATAKELGKYAEPFEEDGIEYIIKKQFILDMHDGMKKIRTIDYFTKYKGQAKERAKSLNDYIEKKGGA